MAVRATPEQYYRTNAKVQTQEPVLVAAYPTAQIYPSVQSQMPPLNNTGVLVLGIVAVVGLVGLFAVLAFSNRRCNC